MEVGHAGDGTNRFLLFRDVRARPHPAREIITVVQRPHLPVDRPTAALTQPILTWNRVRRTPSQKRVGLVKRRRGRT